MNESPINFKYVFLSGVFALIVVVGIFIFSFFDKTTKIVFCNVGQGDATYIRVNNSVDILIDAGPQNQILNCLGKHMPFYDRQIELALLSHPQKDHYGGFIPLLKRFRIKYFFLKEPFSINQTFLQLIRELKKQSTKIIFYQHQNYINLNQARITLLRPKNQYSFINSNNANDQSLIFALTINRNHLLFTGDASSSLVESSLTPAILPVYILKIPHHGSKSGLAKKLLRLADPNYSVISVGKNNAYGHPAKETLDLLKALRIKTYRTDIDGDVVFKIE